MLRCADLDLRERIRKYDLNVEDGAELDENAFRNYLLEKVAVTRSEVRLDVILRGLRFDPYLKDPREKVGRVFQYVDKMLEKHGVVGTFQAKDIAKCIVRAVEPAELRERVEFDLSTEEGKQYGRNLQMLYTLIVGKFTLWYTLYPDGAAARPARRGELTRNVEFRGPAPRGLCFNCGRAGHKARGCNGAGQFQAAGAPRVQRVQDHGFRRGGDRQKQEMQCYKCNRRGHMARECTAHASREAASGSRYRRDEGRTRFPERKQEEQRAPFMRSARVAAPPRSALKRRTKTVE